MDEEARSPVGDNDVLSVCLFGVPGAERNLGVGALRLSAAFGVLRRVPDARVTIFDDGWGLRAGQVQAADETHEVQLCGARHSRRFHRRESYANMRASALVGARRNPGLTAIDSADAVLDISGGDSFSDLYGVHRFRTVAWPKRLTLARGRPLILLPQTYGPFRDRRLSASAARLTRGATMAWARDTESYDALQELLGDEFDKAKHRLGVDMAFALPTTVAQAEIPAWVHKRDAAPVVGVNISSLVALDRSARKRYGLRANYPEMMRLFLTQLLQRGCRVVLIPHVIGHDAGLDADNVAQQRIFEMLPQQLRRNVALSQPGLDPSETKWLISQLDWFVGARMHSTIAGLSSGVPTAAVAYSYKTRGVFQSCGVGDNVVDARSTDTLDAVDQLLELFERRDETRGRLAQQLPSVLEQANRQMDEIVAVAQGRSHSLERT